MLVDCTKRSSSLGVPRVTGSSVLGTAGCMGLLWETVVLESQAPILLDLLVLLNLIEIWIPDFPIRLTQGFELTSCVQ